MGRDEGTGDGCVGTRLGPAVGSRVGTAVGKATTVETAQGASNTMASGCTLNYDGTGSAKAFFNTKATKQCCGAGVKSLKGKAASLVGMEISVTNATSTITLTGPDGVWFGAGFFAQSMNDKPYSIIVDGKGAVSERRMDNHAAGTVLAPTVAVSSNTVVAGKRTVVLSRPSLGASAQHATFSLQDLEVPFISAISPC